MFFKRSDKNMKEKIVIALGGSDTDKRSNS